MNRQLLVTLAILGSQILGALSLRANEAHLLQCGHCAMMARLHARQLAAAETGKAPQNSYAPDRLVDIAHLKIDVTPNFKERSLAATVVLDFAPIAKPLKQWHLNATGLDIRKVTSSHAIQATQSTDTHLEITFREPIPAWEDARLTVTYNATPKKGLYFRTAEMGYPAGDTQLWTQGEPEDHQHWFPSHDYPNEKFTTEMICRVPEGMEALSNGRLLSQKKDEDTGLVAFHWFQDKAHVNYLVTLLAGYFVKMEDTHGKLPVALYVPPSEKDQLANTFRDTIKILDYFEREIGVPYPWDKYYNACAIDYMWGGMENTSLSTLNASTLFSLETENIRSSQGLVAHELAHQWFGDLVTCKDWSHIWLNEGFATYYTHLFAGHKDGRDHMLYGLYRDKKRITGRSGDVVAMVNRKYDRPSDMFRKYGFMSYTKGSWVLHMIRSEVGPEIFRRAVKAYLLRHRHGNVVTENLRAALEEASGRNFDRFFDQFVYHAHHPELKIDYSWDQKRKLAKLSVRQEQKVDENVMLFEVKLPVRFRVGGRIIDHDVAVSKVAEDFYFALPASPDTVRVDPNLTLLAKITFSPSVTMLHKQLADPKDVIGRLLAVEALGKRKDKTSVEKIRDALYQDPFYGVRLAASRALRGMDTDQAFEAIVSSPRQPDARVRRQVVTDLGGFYRPTALTALKKSLQGEKNPAVRGSAIRALAGFGDSGAAGLIRKALITDSYRHQLADAAVSALRSQDDPAEIGYLLGILRKDSAKFTSRGYGSGLKALAYLARNEKDKSKIRRFLLESLDAPNPRIKLAAIEALGQLGDPMVIASLEKIASGREGSPERQRAEQAVEKLRAGRKPVDDFKNLRLELSDLKKANESLEKKVEELGKRLDFKPYPDSPDGNRSD